MNQPLTTESRMTLLKFYGSNCCIKGDCGGGLTPSHFFKTNTMLGNKYWNYSDTNNVLIMCPSHHAEYELLSAEKRIEFIQSNSNFDQELKEKIVRRMGKLLAGKKPNKVIDE